MGIKITIIGAGYVGLVSAACFAKLGHDVICVDNNPGKIEFLKSGKVPIYEPGLDVLLNQTLQAKKISFSSDTGASVRDADIVMLAVGTPTDVQKNRVDLSYVYAAAESIAPHLKTGAVVVTKSTVPVGTTRQVQKIIRDKNPALEFAVASNPEFLREGHAVSDFMKPDRVVIGADSPPTHSKVAGLYQALSQQGIAVLRVSIESSELIKYAANAFLATKIAFINEIADLAEQCGANIVDVAHGIGTDGRIGSKFLNPGPGYGGSCFPKDTLGLAGIGADTGVDLKIVQAVIASNTVRKQTMAQKIVRACGGSVNGKIIAVLGLAFKAETDDMRDAPAIDILQSLDRAGAKLHCYDPKAMENAKSMMPFIQCHNDIESAAHGADAIVILTEWHQFKSLDFNALKNIVRVPLLIDLRNIADANAAIQSGFDFVSIGRADMAGKDSARILKHG